MSSSTVIDRDLLAPFHVHLRFLRRSPNTQRHYLQTARRFLEAFPTLSIELLTPEHIEEHLASRVLSAASTRTELACLRAFFAWCIREKRLLRKNPCDGVEWPKVPQKIRQAVSPEDFQRLLAVCRTPEERLLLEGLYMTGLRLNEFRPLTWEQVDLARRRIAIRGKGSHERTAVWRKGEIRAFEGPAGTGYLLPYRRGPWGEMRIERTLRRLAQEAGLRYRVTAHILRHGWFKRGKRQGLSLEVLARLGGHKHVSTTAAMYAPMDVDDLQEVYGKVLDRVTEV